MKSTGKYSIGIGDRFARQGKAQLKAVMMAEQQFGFAITPVWNKSNREHCIVHSQPADTRAEADQAVKAMGYAGAYFVDADHINLSTVDRFIEHSDFFTLDLADFIGKNAAETDISSFVSAHRHLCGKLAVNGIKREFEVTEEYLEEFAKKFLFALNEAFAIYRHIASARGEGTFVTEVSMDEVDEPQKPIDMFFILKVIADLGLPAQTIAPKFTGRFNKGVDYDGKISSFSREFEEDIRVIAHAVKEFGLRDDFKLSVHSGSDKFSIYPVIGSLIRKHDCGIHVKTSGTTWIEEVIGLSISGDSGLDLAKEIYASSYGRMNELCVPYATVTDIRPELLPLPETVRLWSGAKFASTLRHNPEHPDYNPGFRQLIHVGYKVAAEMGDEYMNALAENERVIADCVTDNILTRHLARLFSCL